MKSAQRIWVIGAMGLCAHATQIALAADEGHVQEKVNLFSGDLGNALWTLLIFALVLLVLGKFAWGPILKVLQTREQFIRESLESAKREREEAELVKADYTERLNKAREEATAIVDEGRRDAEEVRKRIHVEAKQEADAMVDRAGKEISLARDQAVKDLYDQTVVLATTVAGKILRKELSVGDHRVLIDESLAEIGRLNN